MVTLVTKEISKSKKKLTRIFSDKSSLISLSITDSPVVLAANIKTYFHGFLMSF